MVPDSNQKALPPASVPEPRAAEGLPCVVAIGASAGGLEGFSKLVQTMPGNTGMAFVLIQHLDPSHGSALPEILSRSTSMPVKEATDGMRLEPNNVYTIPPDQFLSVDALCFKLSPRGGTPRPQLAIDHFFRSLAVDRACRAIAVILSGAGSDGALGIQEVKAAGGIIFVQDPQSAQVDSMPRSAIATGCVDFIMPVEDMAAEIARIGRSPLPSPARGAGTDRPFGIAEAALQEIYLLIRGHTGVDFAHYKQATIVRRIARRMALQQTVDIGAYIDFLKANPEEIKALHQDFLIQVTQFFRDADTFDALRETFFPALVRSRGRADTIRVWVPGCSTGEEVYSLAICLAEALGTLASPPAAQIFGTDLNDVALSKARAGYYIENISEDVSADRLKRFFTQAGNHYRIAKSIREMCIFARQNVASDPPFSNMDFISCRNLLIYMEPALQKRIMPVFHYALKPAGHLMLGMSENISTSSELFTIVDKRHKIFSKRLIPNRDSGARFVARLDQLPHTKETINSSFDAPLPNVLREVERVLMDSFPGVIVDDKMNIIQFRGDTGPFLVAASGVPSFNLFKMAKDSMLVELRQALFEAKADGSPTKKRNVRLGQDDRAGVVNFEVFPFKVAPAGDYYYLVAYQLATPDDAGRPEDPRASLAGSDRTETAKVLHELQATKDYLQAIITDHERTNEELRAANEEILSSNEELQSSNEELETAKEEMQSSNEELKTLYEELLQKNVELGSVYGDLNNLFSSLHIPVVILSLDLKVRRFTPAAKKILRFTDADIGRPIDDIKSNLILPNFERLLVESIETVGASETEVQDTTGSWYTMRIRPYRTVDNRIDGVVVTFSDVSKLKRDLSESNQAWAYATALLDVLHEPALILDASMTVRAVTNAFATTFNISVAQAVGRKIFEIGLGLWEISKLKALLDVVLSKKDDTQADTVNQEFASIGHKPMRLNARRVPLGVQGDFAILMAFQEVP